DQGAGAAARGQAETLQLAQPARDVLAVQPARIAYSRAQLAVDESLEIPPVGLEGAGREPSLHGAVFEEVAPRGGEPGARASHPASPEPPPRAGFAASARGAQDR